MSHPRRAGFTLVELLVVISILAVVSTLVVIYVLPAFQDNKNVVRGADRLTTALLIAKNRALRDQHPVGVRILLDADGLGRRFVYVEQPDNISGANATLTASSDVVTITGMDLMGSASSGDYENYVVQPGDWLRLNPPPLNTSQNLEIIDVPSNSTVRVRNAPGTAGDVPLFTVVRGSRPITGEEGLEMPLNVVVDFSAMNNYQRGTPATYPYQINMPPARQDLVSKAVTGYEIMFSPNGMVFNRSSPSPIVMLVRDETKPAFDPLTTHFIAVYRQGLVAGHPVNNITANDPAGFALDGKPSGL